MVPFRFQFACFARLMMLRRQILPDSASTLPKSGCPQTASVKRCRRSPRVTMAPRIDQGLRVPGVPAPQIGSWGSPELRFRYQFPRTPNSLNKSASDKCIKIRKVEPQTTQLLVFIDFGSHWGANFPRLFANYRNLSNRNKYQTAARFRPPLISHLGFQFKICSHIQSFTLNRVEIFKTSVYDTNHTPSTKIHLHLFKSVS